MVQISGVYQLIPVEVGSWNPNYLQGLGYIPGICLGFLNHQQYEALISGGGSLGGGRFTSHKEIDRHQG